VRPNATQARVFVIHYLAALAATATWSQLLYVRERTGADTSPVLFLCGVGACYGLVRARVASMQAARVSWEWLWATADVLLVTGIVHWSGGLRSEAALLYFWAVATSAVAREWQRTLYAGLLSAVLYLVVASAPAGYPRADHVAILATREFIIVISTSIAVCFAVTERRTVEELARLRERAAIDQYRSGLSREIHDGVQQLLVRATTQLELASRRAQTDPVGAARAAVEERHTLRRAGDELRYLARRLRSRDLEAEDLARALRARVGEFADRTGIDARLQAGISGASLGAPVEHAAFRFVQEALANAERHSGAQHVTVELILCDGELRCSVVDDGCGFDPQEVAPRQEAGEAIGLLSMSERAAALGGSMQLETSPGSGARLTLTVPVSEAYAMGERGR